MFIRTQTNGSRTYLLLVENERIDGRLVQRVLHRFGRLDELRASGQLDTLVRSLGRFADKVAILDAHAKGATTPTQTRTIGPGLIFERLWRECGLQAVLQEQLATRRFDFDERQAIRRMEAGTLTHQQTEGVGRALIQLEETVRDSAPSFGIPPEDLNLDLGPIGKLI